MLLEDLRKNDIKRAFIEIKSGRWDKMLITWIKQVHSLFSTLNIHISKIGSFFTNSGLIGIKNIELNTFQTCEILLNNGENYFDRLFFRLLN